MWFFAIGFVAGQAIVWALAQFVPALKGDANEPLMTAFTRQVSIRIAGFCLGMLIAAALKSAMPGV